MIIVYIILDNSIKNNNIYYNIILYIILDNSVHYTLYLILVYIINGLNTHVFAMIIANKFTGMHFKSMTGYNQDVCIVLFALPF